MKGTLSAFGDWNAAHTTAIAIPFATAMAPAPRMGGCPVGGGMRVVAAPAHANNGPRSSPGGHPLGDGGEGINFAAYRVIWRRLSRL